MHLTLGPPYQRAIIGRDLTHGVTGSVTKLVKRCLKQSLIHLHVLF